MTEIKPDTTFRQQIKAISGSDLTTCMQCGSCSVVCSLAPDDRPFPRKEMLWAGWGMKDRLVGNPDIWLCHQCGDCSTTCPRGVNPADVLSAARQLTYRHYARPRFLGKLLAEPSLLAVAILIPVVIISAILLLAGTFRIPEGPVNYSKFFPHAWLNISFSLITFTVIGLTIGGLVRFWKDMQTLFPEAERKSGFFKSLMAVAGELSVHKNFRGCEEQKKRNLAHLLVFYGFILLLFVTLFAILAVFLDLYPLKLTNPFKILGNISSLMLFSGIILMIINRLTDKKRYPKTGYADWLLLISIFLLTLSGTLVETARFASWSLAYHLYFFHLVCVWFVIIYLPYTKFGHILYRTLAMTFARTIGRK